MAMSNDEHMNFKVETKTAWQDRFVISSEPFFHLGLRSLGASCSSVPPGLGGVTEVSWVDTRLNEPCASISAMQGKGVRPLTLEICATIEVGGV